jgi:RHS repeat-associated protein
VKIRTGLLAAWMVVGASLAFSAGSTGENFLFGPQLFQNQRWRWHFSSHAFSADAPCDGLLIIEKTGPGTTLKRGFVFLNWRYISLSGFLRGDETRLEKDVRLRERNRLLIFFSGKPNAGLNIAVRTRASHPPPVIDVSITPETICPGETATLAWDSENAESVEASPDIGSVALSGTMAVSPDVTTVYTLTAHGTSEDVSAQADLTVQPLPGIDIAVSPASVFRGEPAILSWLAHDADHVEIAPDLGPMPLEGSVSVSPRETTPYVFTLSGPCGDTVSDETVAVIDPPETVLFGRLPDEQRGGGGRVGESVRIPSGNAVVSARDAAFPSAHRQGLVFARFYNSRSTTLAALGHGWSHAFGLRLDPNRNLAGRDVVEIVDDTGRSLFFRPTGNGAYQALFGDKSRLAFSDGEFVWRRTSGLGYRFSATGRLERVDDAWGNQLNLTYDARERLVNVSDGAGDRSLSFAYNEDGRITTITGPATEALPSGIYARFAYDSFGNLSSVTYADGSGFDYTYEDAADAHNLTGVTNKVGHRVAAWEYDGQDRCVAAWTPRGTSVSMAYVDDTRVDVTDAYGAVRTYTVGWVRGQSRLVSMAGPAAPPWAPETPVRWAYDDDLNLEAVESPAGTIHRFQDFDAAGNPGTVRMAAGTPDERTLSFTWHPRFNAPLTRREPSVLGGGEKATLWDYDDDGNAIPNEAPTAKPYRVIEKGFTRDVTGTVQAYEYITAMTYNDRGQLTAVDGPLAGTGDTTLLNYHTTTGDLVSIDRPLVGTTVFSDHDAAGRFRVITDVNGRASEISYDALGRITDLEHSADQSLAAMDYDLSGRLSARTDEDGITRSYDYESTYGRLFRLTDHEGNFIEHDYDGQGNLIEKAWFGADEARSAFRRWDFQHPDLPGKLFRSINPDDTYTEYRYDAAGNLASVTDAEGRTVAYEYDALNRIISETRPGGVVTEYARDSHGNLASVTDPEGHVTTYTHDDMGRPLAVGSPDSGLTLYAYDAAGNPAHRVDANGIATTFDHDALGRMTAIHFPDPAQDVLFSYDQGADGMGRRTGMSDPSGTTVFAHDPRGRLTEKTTIVQDVAYTVGKVFTPAGRLLSVTYPSGRTIDHDRTACSCRVDGVSTTFDGATRILAENLAYRPFGAAVGMGTASGDTVANLHDASGRLITANPGAPMERSYTYDNLGNLLTVDAPGETKYNRTYTYDDLYRLETAVGPWGSIGYTYDRVGNRQTRTVNGTTESYAYFPGTNRLESVTGAETIAYDYDAAGNTVGMGDRTLVYNQNNRLARVEEGGAILGTYTYNGMGQRIIKETADGVTIFHYDLDDNIIAESTPDGTFAKEYLYRNNSRLALVDVASGEFYTYLNDRLGTPQMMADDNNVVIWEGVYKPFGETDVNPNSTVTNNFRFPGQYYDEETRLHYNYHRYYHPNLGMYITPDPIGLEGGINVFVYAINNPINDTDQYGLLTESYNESTGGGWALPPFHYNPSSNQFKGIIPSFGTLDPSKLKKGADKKTGPLAFYEAGTALVITGAGVAKYGSGIMVSGGPIGWFGGGVVTLTGVGISAFGWFTIYEGYTIQKQIECHR